MKKFLSLMIISLMILSCFTLTAFADNETLTWTASKPDAEGYFTWTATANFDTWSIADAFKYDTSKVQLVKTDAAEIDAVLNSSYDSKLVEDNGSGDVHVTTSNSSSKNIVAGTELVVIKFKLIDTVTDASKIFEATLVDDYLGDTYGGTLEGADSNFYDVDSGTLTVVRDASALVTSKPDPEDWKDTVKDTTTGDIKFPETSDKIGTNNDADLTTDADVKKVVIFAKAVDALTGTKDGSANYGITIGGMYYPGYLSVPAGSNWSIILVDPNNTLTGSYSASVTVGSETKTLENVSFK